MKFTGWVPVISGNLSFTQIGRTRNITPKMCVNDVLAGTSQQVIALSSTRKLNDGIWPSGLRSLRGIETKFIFGLVAHTTNSVGSSRDRLTGIVYLALNDDVPENVMQYAVQNVGNINLDQIVLRVKNSTQITRHARFVLLRNGRLDLEIDGEDNGISEKIAQQFFFFIKDCAHNHYHHNPKSDQITRLHRNDTGGEDWVLATSYALQRAIVAARRFQTEKKIREAMGILSYAASFEKRFQSALAHDKLSETSNAIDASRTAVGSGNNQTNGVLYEFSLKSLEVILDQIKERKRYLASQILTFVTIVFSTLAIIVGFGQVDEIKEKPWGSGFIEFAIWSIKHPLNLSLGFAALVTVLQQWIFHDSLTASYGVSLARSIVRRLLAFPRWLVVAFVVLLASLIAFSAYGIIKIIPVFLEVATRLLA